MLKAHFKTTKFTYKKNRISAHVDFHSEKLNQKLKWGEFKPNLYTTHKRKSISSRFLRIPVATATLRNIIEIFIKSR